MEAGGDAEEGDHLGGAAEGAAEVAGGAGLALFAAVFGELGPVERPGLLDGVRLDAAGELGILLDQLEVDRTLGGAVGMVLDRRGSRRLVAEELGEGRLPVDRFPGAVGIVFSGRR